MSKFKEFKRGFHAFGLSVNKVVSFIMLTFVYFIGIGVTSVLGKIFRKSFLPKMKNQSSSLPSTHQTFWFDINISPDIEECRRSF